MSNKVNIEDIKKHFAFAKKVNAIDVNDLEIYENGERVEISEELLEEWEYVGLTTLCFIEIQIIGEEK